MSKLFFDTFSNRLTEVEGKLHTLSGEIQKLKVSDERMQISDLVLLERIQKAEVMLKDSLGWLRRVAELFPSKESSVTETPGPSLEAAEAPTRAPAVRVQPLVVSMVQPGILAGITTPTELQVVSLLAEQGSKSAPEIGRAVGRSREHTARLLKKLYEEGYVKRDQARIPFRYSLVERVRASLKKEEKRENEETATAAAPQT